MRSPPTSSHPRSSMQPSETDAEHPDADDALRKALDALDAARLDVAIEPLPVVSFDHLGRPERA